MENRDSLIGKVQQIYESNRSPKKTAQILNKNKIRSLSGVRWTPGSVAVLMHKMKNQRKQADSPKTKTVELLAEIWNSNLSSATKKQILKTEIEKL